MRVSRYLKRLSKRNKDEEKETKSEAYMKMVKGQRFEEEQRKEKGRTGELEVVRE